MSDSFTAFKTTSDSIDWSRRKFLVVEDNEDHQWLMSTVLRDTGVEIAVVGKGEEAVGLVKASVATGRPFDLILMDIRLPTIDGYETTRQIRAGGYGGPVVAITARAMEKEIEECHTCGCNACVRKPFDRATLCDTISALLAEEVPAN